MLAGSPTAFDRLFRLHVASVRRVAVSVSRNPESAEDLVQEVFIFLWRHGDRYNPARGGLGPWLRTIARNRALDVLRAEVRQERLAVSAVGESRTLALAPDPLDATIAAERAACVRSALDRLPRAQRQAVLLSYGAGLTDLQVARVSGVPLGTVKSRLRLSRQHLARRLARDGMA
ncbi:MAG: sigma-70 family RNA polymerase sigma factor [Miltoncostaeaceae bacterium]